MNREKPLKNHIYSISIPDRDYGESEREVEERDRSRENIAWFIPNSPPLPNATDNYRRYRRGLERQSEIEMMLIIHQQQARPGQGRVKVGPCSHPRRAIINDRGRNRFPVPIRHLEAPIPANNGDGVPSWSLFQVWNNLAYVTCSMPFRIAWEDQEGRYCIKYSRIQQVFCGAQHILSTVEMVSWWRRFVNVFSNGANPLMYVQFGYQVLLVTKRICYMKTTIFGIQQDLLQVHNYAVNSEASTGYQIKMGKVMTIIASAGYSIYLCGYSAINFALYTFRDQKGWNWGFAEFIQTFACYTRKIFIWGTEQDCPDDIFLSLEMVPRQEILYGCLGILTFVSATLAQIHTTLMIMSSCLSLLYASHSLTNTDRHDISDVSSQLVAGNEILEMQQPLTTRYEFLEKFAGKISSFVGLMFLLTLGVTGLSFPNVLDKIFNNYDISTLSVIMPLVMMIASCLGACISAMQIDTLEDRMTEIDNIEQLPSDIRRLIIYLHRLFRRSSGIGYRGLFVMNFVYLVTYSGAVAGLVAFTYENRKQEKSHQIY